MQYWLMKSEPDVWSIDQQKKTGVKGAPWDGVRNYQGGELVLFRGNEFICKEFNTPGSAIIFPAFTNHKVNKITSGTRHTLAIWMSGPKFR